MVVQFSWNEISEMELSSQAKLLRVLEEQKFRPLSSLNEISVNVLASNKNLIECIQKIHLEQIYIIA